ncbi:MAG: hypothetical protein ACRD3W_30630, partial [Terriglobales bacterium]
MKTRDFFRKSRPFGLCTAAILALFAWHASLKAAATPEMGGAVATLAPGAVADENGKRLKPTAVLAVGDDLYLLTPGSLWQVERGVPALYEGGSLSAHKLGPLPQSAKGADRLPLQELCNMTYLPNHDAVVVLDKSGDLYEYLRRQKKWQMYRSNLPFLPHQPDPEFIDLSRFGTEIALLDPERNQIWKVAGPVRVLPAMFPDILPWKVKAGDAILGDATGIAYDGVLYVMRRNGNITVYGDGHGTSAPQTAFKYPRTLKLRASRLITAAGAPLYIVSREENCVVAIDKKTRKTKLYAFAQGSDLRGLLPAQDGFWILNNGVLQH